MNTQKSGMNRKQPSVYNKFYDDSNEDVSCSDSCEEDVSENVESKFASTLNLEDCLVDGRDNKWKYINIQKNTDKKDFEILDASVDYEYEKTIDISKLHQDGYTYINADIMLKGELNFSEQILELGKNEKLRVKKIDDRRISVDLGRMLWKEIVTEACIFVIIQHIEEGKMNYLITSTIPCHPAFKNSKTWSEKLKSKCSILESIEYIATGYSENMNIVGSLKNISNFFKNQKSKGQPFGYSKKLESVMEWKHPLYLKLPNDNDHKSWAYGIFCSNIGKREDWAKVWKIVGEEIDKKTSESFVSKETMQPTTFELQCEQCGNLEPIKLYKMKSGKFRCDGCIRKFFYYQLRLGKAPVQIEFDLQDGTCSLDILASIIPLPVLNFYILMVFKQLFSLDDIQSCPSCKSVLRFNIVSEYESVHINSSCPCSYTWCSKCLDVPHWPMLCSEFSTWNENWQWRYVIPKAIGPSNRFVIRVVCYCQNVLFYAMAGNRAITVNCPVCASVNVLDYSYGEKDYSMDRIYYKYGRKKNKWPKPVLMDSKLIEHIPTINKNYVIRCSEARTDRFNIEEINKLRVKNGTSKRLKTISQTILYLAESVTAWMISQKENYQNIEKMLKQLIDDRRKMIEDENKRESVFYEKLETDINKLMKAVEGRRRTT